MLFAWLRRRRFCRLRQLAREFQPAPAPLNLSALVETLLVKKLEAETRLEEARAKTALDQVERELALRKQSDEWRLERRKRNQELGRRRAESAKRAANGRMLPNAEQQRRQCKQCINPSDPSLTEADIIFHGTHLLAAETQQ